MRIIWVEDSKVLKYTLTVYCNKYGAKVRHITDIDEFCENEVKNLTEDDLILLDLLFDKEGEERDDKGRGYKALTCLEDTGKSNIPVVILTVLNEKEVEPIVKKYINVRQIIRKPVFPEELEEALNKAWEWKKHQIGE